VWLVGAGPGHPGYITVAGQEALRMADVVLYDRLAAPELLDETRSEALLIDVGKSPRNQRMTQDEINACLVEHGQAGRRVVRLKGGDPFVFGRGGEELLALAAAGVPCTVIPGVTSAIGGLAAGGIPVTHRAVATSFAVVTGHEDPTKPESQVDWARLALAADTLIVLMGVERLAEIARAIIDGGRDAETPAALVQEASTARQRTVTATLGTIAAVAAANDVRNPALFVVGDVAALQSQLDPARLAPLAGQRILVTRARSQASKLVTALRMEGAYPLVLPAIEITQRVDADAMRATIEQLRADGYRWIVLTSTNAVDVFLDALLDEGGDIRLLHQARICAIGAATASALRARGLLADLVPDDATGEGVAAALLASGPLRGTRVLLPRAQGARDVIPDALLAAGAKVDDLPLYLAAPVADPPADVLEAVRAGALDIVTFTSSSTVTNLVRLLDGDLTALRSATIACIGPITAATAREAGLTPHVVADQHTVDGLVTALRTYVHSQRKVD
jgi:uroporphyrinogen III methyltransferase/synthase